MRIRNNWGKPKRAPHLSLIRENRCIIYVCMYVCMCVSVYVVIRRPRTHRAIAKAIGHGTANTAMAVPAFPSSHPLDDLSHI